MATLIQKVVEQILGQQALLDVFQGSSEFHLSVDNPPWMRLVIERHGDQVSVAHYAEPLNGDAIRDPEICYRYPDWSPLWIQQDPVGRFAQVHVERAGQQYIYPRLLIKLKQFSAMWARNLCYQGFTDPSRVRVKSLTHPQLLAEATSHGEPERGFLGQ
jgi:hypothetical protein